MQVIIPSKLETEITGLIAAGEYAYYGARVRVELRTDRVRFLLNECEARLSDQPLAFGKRALNAAKQLIVISRAPRA